MAIALEELTPEAGAAVSAARAGAGAKLSSAVRSELKAKAGKAVTKAATTPSSSPSLEGPVTHAAAGVVHGAASGAAAINTQGAKVISGGKGGTAARIIFAFGAGLLALEVASYLSGRYFNYNIGKGIVKAQTAAQYIGLYPGQAAKLAAPAAPVNSALSHYGTAV